MQPLWTEAELLAENRAFTRQYLGATGEPLTTLPPPSANLEALVTLGNDRLVRPLRFRARRFRVPPVPFREGLALAELQAELARVQITGPESPGDRIALLRRQLAVLKEAAARMWVLVRPVGLWDRLIWRWRANPFDQAEAQELADLFAFFCTAPMTPRIRWSWVGLGATSGRQTSLRTGQTSRTTTPPSWARTASPAPGPTTSSGAAP